MKTELERESLPEMVHRMGRDLQRLIEVCDSILNYKQSPLFPFHTRKDETIKSEELD